MDKETQKKQRFIERLENITIPQRYSMRVDELIAIYEKCDKENDSLVYKAIRVWN